jgi:hypothetical protein
MSDKDGLSKGDLAIIIKSVDGLSVGKIVECVQIDFVDHPQYGVIWLVKSSRQDLVSEYGGVTRDFHVPQTWLKKIPTDPLPDEEDGKEIYDERLIEA